MLALRWAGGLHAAVLQGADPALAAAYPHPDRPGDPERAWRVAEALAARDPGLLEPWLASPPQTNETQRALALLPGLLTVSERFCLPLDLLELGASAGLNLHMDAFAYRTEAWSWGNGPVRIAGDWRGPPPRARPIQVRSRRGCDEAPLDPSSPEHRLRLSAFVWADQFDRLARLRAALDLAAASPVRVERSDALPWLRARLAERRPGAVTVVYHSVFLQYPPVETRAALEAAMHEAGAAATHEAPLAWLRMERGAVLGRPDETTRMWLDLITWPGAKRRALAEVDPHGRHVHWASAA
jgi:hypothetical protein